MNSKRIYAELVRHAKQRGTIDGYKERHHVIPRSLGGEDTPQNLIELTAREHYLAHWLLFRMFENGNSDQLYSMAAAFKCMCSFNRHTGRQSSRDYGKARAIFAEHRTGKTKETCPILAASAKKRTGQNSATNPRIAACAKRAKGKTKETCPTLAAMSKTKAGRTKLTHASVASQAKKLTGRTKHNHSGVAAFTQKKSKHIYVIDGVEYLGGRDASNDSGLCRESIARICIRVELDQIIQASAIKGATVKGSILYGRYDLIGQSYSVLGISRKLNPSYTGNKT